MTKATEALATVSQSADAICSKLRADLHAAFRAGYEAGRQDMNNLATDVCCIDASKLTGEEAATLILRAIEALTEEGRRTQRNREVV